MIMLHDHDEPEAMLDDYLDGCLDDEAHAAFERTLEQQPALRRVVEQQRAIDASIRRSMPAPTEEQLRVIASAAVRRHERRHLRPRRTADRAIGARRSLAVAAAFAFLVGGAWLVLIAIQGPKSGFDPYAIAPRRSAGEIYRAEVESGFEPMIVCRDDEEFQGWFMQRLGQPVALRPLPDGVRALGLDYAHVLTPWTMYVLFEVDGVRMILLVDRLDHDGDQVLPVGDGLYAHRAELGDLVVYEISPLDEARVLDRVFLPDDPGDMDD